MAGAGLSSLPQTKMVFGGNVGEGCWEMQRGAQENLWPKFILSSAPIARHFV